MDLYAIFHLNLAFSSIDKSDHAQVVDRCYWPLLSLIEHHEIPLGIEASAYTLEKINAVDASWIEKLKVLLRREQCEFIASGDSQIIGPLVPATVNEWNLELGARHYRELLGVTPAIAYINEQTLSASLIDIYIDQGYTAIVAEWDNAKAVNPDWQESFLYRPAYAVAQSGRKIPLLWNWSIGFQKLQRLAHKQLSPQDYQQFVLEAQYNGIQALPIYGNDAEIFDYRPGRYQEESAPSSHSEWQTIGDSFKHLQLSQQWLKPSDIVKKHIDKQSPALYLTSAQSPVIVKKQRKYNLSRWAISGRNDLLLNTLCYRRYQDAIDKCSQDPEQWRSICRLWASDLRTHLTTSRFQLLQLELKQFEQSLPRITTLNDSAATITATNVDQYPALFFDKDRNQLTLTLGDSLLRLNLNRGGAIDCLAFFDTPVIGTLHHGHFDDIHHGADFYSNHVLVELITQRKRVTDLSGAQWSVEQHTPQDYSVTVEITTELSTIRKTYRLSNSQLSCKTALLCSERPEGVVRVGWLTLLDSNDTPIQLQTHLGGRQLEAFNIVDDIDHGQPSSTLVSASNCLGATEGLILFGKPNAGVRVSWNPASCAAIPMLYNKTIDGQRLSRLFFSLSELDETHCKGGSLLPFEFSLSPWLQQETQQ